MLILSAVLWFIVRGGYFLEFRIWQIKELAPCFQGKLRFGVHCCSFESCFHFFVARSRYHRGVKYIGWCNVRRAVQYYNKRTMHEVRVDIKLSWPLSWGVLLVKGQSVYFQYRLLEIESEFQFNRQQETRTIYQSLFGYSLVLITDHGDDVWPISIFKLMLISFGLFECGGLTNTWIHWFFFI